VTGLNCYGSVTKEQWDAEQDTIDAAEREAWVADQQARWLEKVLAEEHEREKKHPAFLGYNHWPWLLDGSPFVIMPRGWPYLTFSR
jgi:hypothetical protein